MKSAQLVQLVDAIVTQVRGYVAERIEERDARISELEARLATLESKLEAKKIRIVA